jgi:hypothetical protein
VQLVEGAAVLLVVDPDLVQERRLLDLEPLLERDDRLAAARDSAVRSNPYSSSTFLIE